MFVEDAFFLRFSLLRGSWNNVSGKTYEGRGTFNVKHGNPCLLPDSSDFPNSHYRPAKELYSTFLFQNSVAAALWIRQAHTEFKSRPQC